MHFNFMIILLPGEEFYNGIHKNLISIPNFMCKMHETDIFVAFYILQKIISTNITK